MDLGFRMFAHSKNSFWDLDKLDVQALESPTVPSGMTGGVEYEAMSYAVSTPFFLFVVEFNNLIIRFLQILS